MAFATAGIDFQALPGHFDGFLMIPERVQNMRVIGQNPGMDWGMPQARFEQIARPIPVSPLHPLLGLEQLLIRTAGLVRIA